MKKSILFFINFLFIGTTFCQTAITINAADMPIPTSDLTTFDITSANPLAASLGNNQNWDYSSYSSSTLAGAGYTAETMPFFTNAGIDIYTDGVKDLTPTSGYEVTHELDFNASGIHYAGMYVYEQSIPLVNFTGNSGDSIKFQAQSLLYSTPRTIAAFPFTANSAWHSKTSRTVVNFNITIASAGLNNTPGKHVFRYTENDSVVGWGKLRVYTQNGASIPYDVLMVRHETYATDSMYLGGAPAPTQLLTAFGITQGQKSNVAYAENFYRKGSWYYLMRRYYKTDNTYSTLNASFVNKDNISTVGVEEAVEYSSLIFPNPTNGSELNVEIMGKNVEFSQYEVIDMLGRTVQIGTKNLNGGDNLKIALNENLSNGTYFVKILNTDNQMIIMEKFDLMR